MRPTTSATWASASDRDADERADRDQPVVKGQSLLLEVHPDVEQITVIIEVLVGPQGGHGVAQSAVQTSLDIVGTGPGLRGPSRVARDHLVRRHHRRLRAHHDGADARDRSSNRHHGRQEEQQGAHAQVLPLDLLPANSTMSTISRISPAATATPIFTLLHGRCPWTSPVTPLMNTWNGRPE